RQMCIRDSHMTKEQIREVFHEKLGYEMSETPEDMTSFVRAILPEKFLEADIFDTVCNIAVSNTGSLSYTHLRHNNNHYMIRKGVIYLKKRLFAALWGGG
ncbi:LUD domain-containing protein, partial [Bacillus pumilus]